MGDLIFVAPLENEGTCNPGSKVPKDTPIGSIYHCDCGKYFQLRYTKIGIGWVKIRKRKGKKFAKKNQNNLTPP